MARIAERMVMQGAQVTQDKVEALVSDVAKRLRIGAGSREITGTVVACQVEACLTTFIASAESFASKRFAHGHLTADCKTHWVIG